MDVGSSLMNAGLYLGLPAIALIGFAQWKWWKTASSKIKVIEILNAGGTRTVYVPKDGPDITIENKELGVIRTWPINQLATIPTQYPDMGLLPAFLCRDIQTVIIHEGDWEPMLNRSPHRSKIASPDIVKFLLGLADDLEESGNQKDAARIKEQLVGISTGPTREMIADPAVLGALKVSAVMKALASVGDDLLEALTQIRNQLSRFAGLNATYIYIGLVLAILLSAAGIFFQIQGTGMLTGDEGVTPANTAVIDKLNTIESRMNTTQDALNRIMDELGIPR